ncbi:putative puratrophin-1 isoform X1 [Sesbania bispinosa]|nr:putative puratrophin-1 isoform X1 [Sesbania bispinosa]
MEEKKGREKLPWPWPLQRCAAARIATAQEVANWSQAMALDNEQIADAVMTVYKRAKRTEEGRELARRLEGTRRAIVLQRPRKWWVRRERDERKKREIDLR